jgi:hypothetical protein
MIGTPVAFHKDRNKKIVVGFSEAEWFKKKR